MRAGIIGYGLAGRYFHAPNLAGAGIEVAAICSRSSEKRALAHEDFPTATLVTSVDELLHENLDLIVVASTNDVHVEHASAAINAGIPTVVDKPLGRNLEESQRLFDLADDKGIPLTVFFNRIFDSHTLTIEKIKDEGLLGDLFRFESRFERYRPTLTPGAWRENADMEGGGGLLLDLQTHLVSAALHLFGRAELVHSTVRSIRGAADDDVVLVLSHDSGVDSYLSVSAVMGSPGPCVRLSGREGTLIFQDLDKQEALLRKGYRPINGSWADPSEVTSEGRLVAGERSVNLKAVPGNYAEFYLRVKNALLNNGDLPVSRELALAVAEILDQARRMSSR